VSLKSKLKIKRLFIANRGEIARRIALTAQRLGIETVAITDRVTPPAFLADVVTHLHRVPEETTALYLDAATMIRIATGCGCDAVHPGFGFLSENAEFAASVISAGLVWVGPSPESIEAMASKAAARTLALQAKVPCIEGLDGIDIEKDPDAARESLRKFARSTGFPLLIKAAFGGGGKGMRIVRSESDLLEQAQRAASEARSSFGNGLLVIERYLESPRHVEVQILADKSGKVHAIGDRDCSLQRRHQKIIEEAPAPNLHADTRRAMHSAAVNLAAAVGYDSTGTVEFLVDGSAPETSAQPFYFLEMNTRLQVEHPVTEEVFGLDLVEWQLRIASGEAMPASFAKLEPRGHSVEARIYAEDVHNNFFPAPGPVSAFVTPNSPGIRWETGLDTVDEVTTRFDPMVSKLVATAQSREAALARLAQTLRVMFLANEANNISLLTWLSSVSEFRSRAVSTHFIADSMSTYKDWEKSGRARLEKSATAALDAVAWSSGAVSVTSRPSSAVPGSASLAGQLTLQAFGAPVKAPAAASEAAEFAALHHEKVASHDGTTTTRLGMGSVRVGNGPEGRYLPFHFAVRKTGADRVLFINLDGHNFKREISKASLIEAASRGTANATASRHISAPVPGKIVAIKVAPGAEVDEGAPVLVIESMKMEFEVKSQRQGRVESIDVAVGEQVSAGQTVVRWSE
jgi:acetyl/propionyl-CoA carboxylase alpha subunit